MSEQECRALVRVRSAGFCELAIPGICTGRAASAHHRFKASHGGGWTPANILDGCGDGTTGCHGWVEAHPSEAQLRGLWLTAGMDPRHEAVLMSWRGIYGWFALDDDGGVYWPGKT